jgi:transposase
MICIGIDWADDKHDICIRDAEDRRILAEFVILHDASGVAQFEETIRALGYSPAECLVAVETPHGLLVGYLLQMGYQVYAIPPLAVERYRDRHRISGAKSDPIDASVLSDILCVDRCYHRPIAADSPLAQEIKLVSRQRQCLVAERTRVKNQLTACLKAYYPIALRLFSGLDRAITWAFLRACPNAQAAAQVTQEELEQFFRQQSYTCMRKVPQIHAQLQAPFIPVAAWQQRAFQRQMLVLVNLLANLSFQIKAYEREISRLLDQHPDAFVFRSLPNAGDVTAARLLGEIGDCRNKFKSARAMQALAGSCPVTVQSNKRRRIKFRVACSKPFRDALQQFARLSIQGPKGSSWATGYMTAQLSRGHSVSRALRALGNRWLVIIYRIWQDRAPYDERIHLRSRAQHGYRLILTSNRRQEPVLVT